MLQETPDVLGKTKKQARIHDPTDAPLYTGNVSPHHAAALKLAPLATTFAISALAASESMRANIFLVKLRAGF